MEILTTYNRFREHVSDDVSAALLTLAAALGDKADDKLLSVQEAAERLAVSTDKVYDLCKSGKLRHHRIGGSRGPIRISPDDLGPRVYKLRELMG